ncbi:hypothetical protein PQQ65_03475 [Paraburkholderia strydomiana]|uniref:hypothetical protein n=1 Tax=Paraburkholderia strydomiana TaxID=1245417 RepID=UPI0038BCEBDF
MFLKNVFRFGGRMPVSMFVDDNGHYSDAEYRSGPRVFETADAALAEARWIVDKCLDELHERGMTARALFERYMHFGEDPWLVPWDGGPTVPFSAWDYAKERCSAVCDGQM